jgi:hypothetical protein
LFDYDVLNVKENLYGIKDMAETMRPTEFLEAFMKKPYQHTSLYDRRGRHPAPCLAGEAQGAPDHAPEFQCDRVSKEEGVTSFLPLFELIYRGTMKERAALSLNHDVVVVGPQIAGAADFCFTGSAS